ncbi:10262_t:CDS:2 [Funneliformis geosporum]|uniref:10262_t:CDS:1 n=1 Tax=Funneliformis geosporum TaxID=1117311 RepID=A0A9W4SS52_9GLOM|nr:10262_t:CDS:2 [Funneliformis geosporum]
MDLRLTKWNQNDKSRTTDISTDTPTDTSQQVTSQPAPQQVTSSQTS